MPRLALTDRTLRSLSTTGNREEFWDQVQKGLMLRVSKEGGKVWYVRYRVGARRRRFKLGTYPVLGLKDARGAAQGILRRASRGDDPQAEYQAGKTADTFADLARQYIQEYAKVQKRSWKEDQRKLDKDILPYLGHLKARDITRADVKTVLSRINDRGAPIAAHRTASLIGKVFSFAQDEEIIDGHPALRLPRYVKEEERRRSRVLTDDEIRTFWSSLDEEEALMAATFRLRLLTAQRGREVLTMKPEHVHGDWWDIPGTVTKNGLDHRVYLAPFALELLESIAPLSTEDWIFPSSTRRDTPIRSVQRANGRICERAELADFTPHDLRRTAATRMTELGVSRFDLKQVLNHKTKSDVTAIYDRYSYDAEKQTALRRWALRLDAILRNEGGSNKVVSISQHSSPVLRGGSIHGPG